MYINSKTLAIALGIGSTLMVVSAADNATMFDESMLNSLPGMGSAPPVLGSNIDGGSVFSNYVKARNDGQFFMLLEGITNYEKPSSEKVDVSITDTVLLPVLATNTWDPSGSQRNRVIRLPWHKFS